MVPLGGTSVGVMVAASVGPLPVTQAPTRCGGPGGHGFHTTAITALQESG